MAVNRALIVDEDVEARRVLRDVLRSADWTVDDAPDGVEALGLISQARAYGEGYNCLFSDLILPDLDGLLFLRTMRQQYPELPLVVTSSLISEDDKATLDQLSPAQFVGKPVSPEPLHSALNALNFSTTTVTGAEPQPAAEQDPPVCAYVFVAFESFDLARDLYRELAGFDGVISVNAVKGEGVNLIMRVGADSTEKVTDIVRRVQQVDGILSARHELIVRPPLGQEMQEFVGHYRTVASQIHADYERGVATNAYLMIDIDRYQLERIYLSILLTEGVIRCRVISGLSKLMVLSAGAVRPNVVRHLLGKLAQLDGIRRVREITVVNINE